MTSRLKPEKEPSKPKEQEIEVKNQHEGHAHNDMLSPYSNLPAKKSSPKRPQECFIAEKDITEYLIKGEIQYPELLSDEISKVDETLLKACKRDGQVGGKK